MEEHQTMSCRRTWRRELPWIWTGRIARYRTALRRPPHEPSLPGTQSQRSNASSPLSYKRNGRTKSQSRWHAGLYLRSWGFNGGGLWKGRLTRRVSDHAYNTQSMCVVFASACNLTALGCSLFESYRGSIWLEYRERWIGLAVWGRGSSSFKWAATNSARF